MQSLNKHIFISIHSNIVIDSDYIIIIINNLNGGILLMFIWSQFLQHTKYHSPFFILSLIITNLII